LTVATAFSQTAQALDVERPRAALLGIVGVVVLLAVLLTWFFRAEVTVYEVSKSARIETERTAHSVDAPTAGRVVTSNLVLGARVGAGDVLVELDSESQRRRLTEEQTRLAMLTPEIDAIDRVLAARARSIEDDRQATLAALDEGRAKRDEADIGAKLASEELVRAARLGDAGTISELEVLRTRADADRRRTQTEAASLDLLRQIREQRTRESQGRAAVEDLRHELAVLEGKRATSRAAIDELTFEIERRTIRAPVAGRVEDVATVAVGSYAREGAKLASVVPDGGLRVLAEFSPFTTVGRVKPGQTARIRLDGYPWTQYGEVHGRVVSIGTEVRQGSVRVELELLPTSSPRIPMQHGLTGSAEVAVEKVSPATLVLRTMGKWLARDPVERSSPPPSEGLPQSQSEPRP
jgi:membrane fusion protein (multidrug efflux system)